MAGLAPAAPGYRRLRIAPLPGGGITQAGARLHTPYGTAEVSWALSGRELTVEATSSLRTPRPTLSCRTAGASSRWAPGGTRGQWRWGHTRLSRHRCPWT
ncbi:MULTISPECIES: alpha-L-rhamnosidase C-terminal domain-containing protein [Streptomyces]|uniref:alpha-L-rhamnosidase C-terminal domain-containing protein n=1 Tax=Streptomyces TaxID=1883 RepID=UPI001E4AC4CE|nr:MULTISPECIES: alpha-L-rhamnosidase C-terminal domain-containing protein [Streptomyces]